MGDTWQSGCSSTWHTPAPGEAAPLPENQMNMNSRRLIHPLILQGTKLEDHASVQEPLAFHTANFDSAKPGKTELSNSFLALLSGNSHLTTNFLQLPNVRPALSKFCIPNGDFAVSGSNFGVSVTNIPSFSENHEDVRMRDACFTSFVKSKLSLASTSAKAPDLYRSLHISTSHGHGSRAAKPGSNQSFQGSSTGAVVSSVSCGWPIATSSGDTSQYHTSNIQAPHAKPIEARSSSHSHESAFFRGRPRVFCMNAAGALFLNDMGLLGVLCFCHSMQMSLAKFCEHSGSSSVNPGEGVRLENGMTVARWRRLCFGNNAPDDDKGWGWPDTLMEKNGLDGSMDSGYPTLLKTSGTIDIGGSGNLGKRSKTVHSNDPCAGQTAFKNWANNSMDNKHQRNRLKVNNHISNSLPSSSPSPVPPALVNNHSVQSGKGSPSCLNKASQSILSKGEQNVRSCLIANGDTCGGKFGNRSVGFPSSGIKRSLGHEHYISRESFANEAYIISGEGSSSNVDLRLGQPSQQTHTSVMLFPATTNPLQFGEVHTSRKAQVNLPLKESVEYLRSTKKPRQRIQCARLEMPSSNREQAPGSSNAFNHSEPLELTGDATKNSLISLFLSHLSTERNNSSQSTNTVNDNGPLTTRSPDVDSVSAKGILAEHITDRKNIYEKKYVKDAFDPFNNMDKVNGLLDGNKCCNIEKGSNVVHNKQTTDTRILKPATGEHFLHSNFSVHAMQPSCHTHRESSILQNVADSTNSNQYGEVPLYGNKDQHNNGFCVSINPPSHAISRSGLLDSGTPKALDSKSMNNPEATFPLPHEGSVDLSQHTINEDISLVALGHVVDLSKQDRSSITCKTSPMHQRLCCQKTMELQRMSCHNVLGSAEEFRRGSYCDAHHDASKFATRPVPSCSNCYFSRGAEMLATKPGTRGNECYNCTAVTHRMPQFSTCHVCGAEEHPCLRLGRISNCSSDNSKQMKNQKEQSPSISRNCCCTVLSQSLAGCCFLRGDKPSGYINEHCVCGKSRTVRIAPLCAKNHMFQDVNNIRLGQYECSKNNIVIKNNFQHGCWRDVPTKLGHCDGTSADKRAEVLEASSGSMSPCLGTTLKECDETHQMSESRNQRLMSNNYSGSSAPAITETSVEVNNTNFCATNIEDTKMTCDPVVDDASRIGKCDSSDETLGSSECESLHTISDKEKRRKTMKMNKLNISVPTSICFPINSVSPCCNSTWDSSSPKKSEALQSDNENPRMCNFPIRSLIVRRKRSALFTSKSLPLDIENHDTLSKADKIQSVGVDQTFAVSIEEENAKSLEINNAKQKGGHSDTGKPPKYVSLGSMGNSHCSRIGTASVRVRPVVCGKSGIISSGRQKPAKIVSLSLILNKSKRCYINENGVRCNELPTLKLQHENGSSSDVRISCFLVSDESKGCSKKGDKCFDELPTNESKTADGSDTMEKTSLNHEYHASQTKARYREARSCSLSELIEKNKFATEQFHAPNLGESCGLVPTGEPKTSLSTLAGTECHCPESSISMSFSNNTSLEKHSQKNQHHSGVPYQMNTQRCSKSRKYRSFLLNPDAICSVCGSSEKVSTNYLLECKGCFIRVHQACYGVSKVPKGHWLCRPCKTNSRNIVCVLCGYKGGAMTRAVKSQTIVKSLLKAWNIGTKSNVLESEPSSETDKNENQHLSSVSEAYKFGNSCSVLIVTSPSCEAFPEGAYDVASKQTSIIGYSESVPKTIEVQNSITAGVLDPSVIQWVHMVCGLWTPGTRCLNVNTMNTFDVSGASAARKNIVCSLCNRPGGSCIRCRVLNCCVHFHPWCAHQKGLLQSETEGNDNEMVGFYGRCTLHAAQNDFVVDSPVHAEVASPRKDWTCARTEGFKGRKRDEGSRPSHRKPYSDSGTCIVSQEQINAWLHINGHKSCTRPLAKPPCSEVGSDFRKEYFRYKQLKAWKHLVVYKSGIHALGLYTSQFIARGAMVVEYVGEIVSLRVADKRELEYQSGKRLQYKSACYFFRIDKEHIIDATCKGGIARFVNHSCLPNCVAKVISIRNEKKVVFFAERDINPGEEITYDYHFKREDEGQKIPCLCNSKKCRRYLN